MTETVQKQKHGFQAEVKQLLQLMIHSLYSNKEIFLRELVSNASDAADKLRFKALSDASLFENDGQLRVRLVVDKENRTLTISDNGKGFDAALIPKGIGLSNMKTRARLVKADLHIESAPGKGTRIECRFVV